MPAFELLNYWILDSRFEFLNYWILGSRFEFLNYWILGSQFELLRSSLVCGSVPRGHAQLSQSPQEPARD